MSEAESDFQKRIREMLAGMPNSDPEARKRTEAFAEKLAKVQSDMEKELEGILSQSKREVQESRQDIERRKAADQERIDLHREIQEALISAFEEQSRILERIAERL